MDSVNLHETVIKHFTDVDIKILLESSRELTIQSQSGKERFIYIQPLDLEKDRNVKINKQKLGEPKDNLWVALVLFMGEEELG